MRKSSLLISLILSLFLIGCDKDDGESYGPYNPPLNPLNAEQKEKAAALLSLISSYSELVAVAEDKSKGNSQTSYENISTSLQQKIESNCQATGSSSDGDMFGAESVNVKGSTCPYESTRNIQLQQPAQNGDNIAINGTLKLGFTAKDSSLTSVTPLKSYNLEGTLAVNGNQSTQTGSITVRALGKVTANPTDKVPEGLNDAPMYMAVDMSATNGQGGLTLRIGIMADQWYEFKVTSDLNSENAVYINNERITGSIDVGPGFGIPGLGMSAAQMSMSAAGIK